MIVLFSLETPLLPLRNKRGKENSWITKPLSSQCRTVPNPSLCIASFFSVYQLSLFLCVKCLPLQDPSFPSPSLFICFRVLPGCQPFPEISLWWSVPLPTCYHFKHLYSSSQPRDQALINVYWKKSSFRALSNALLVRMAYKKTWQHAACFSFLMLPASVTNACHFSGLTFSFQSLNQNTLFVQHPTHKIKARVRYHNNNNNKY